MHRRRSSALVLTLTIVGVVVWAALPVGAQGNQLGLQLIAPLAPVKPAVETPFLAAVVTVPCDVVLARIAAPGGTQVALAFTTRDGITISGPSTVAVDPSLCLASPGTTAAEVEAIYEIAVPRTAPGLLASPFTVQATVPASGPAAPAQSPLVPGSITPDAYLESQATLASKLRRCEGGKAVFEMTVENLGNTRTAYEVELAQEPGGNGWAARLPEPFVVDSATQPGATTSQAVEVRVDCALGGEGAFQLVLKPSAADDPTKHGNPLTVQVLARAEGPLGIPGPGPLAVGLALLGVALLARRRVA